MKAVREYLPEGTPDPAALTKALLNVELDLDTLIRIGVMLSNAKKRALLEDDFGAAITVDRILDAFWLYKDQLEAVRDHIAERRGVDDEPARADCRRQAWKAIGDDQLGEKAEALLKRLSALASQMHARTSVGAQG